MTTEVDICNLALGNIGASAKVISIDPPDGSAESIHCERYYRLARNATLEHPWSFNTKRVLGVVEEDQSTLQEQWSYLYSYPSDALTILSVLPLGSPDDEQTQDYKVELFGDAKIIATDLPEATIRYAALITDPNLYSARGIKAMAWELSGMLAGPVVRGESGVALAKHCAQMAVFEHGLAQASDAKNRHGRPLHIPAAIRARGGFWPKGMRSDG